jgi:hypothetical protein
VRLTGRVFEAGKNQEHSTSHLLYTTANVCHHPHAMLLT